MASQPIYQFYVELQDYTPKIWRRFQVLGNVTAARLGYIIMTMFEMQASHLFCIDVMYRRNFYQAMGKSFPAEEIEKRFPPDKIKETCRYEVQNQLTVDFDDKEAENAVYAKISQLVSNSGDEMVLFYDYGDGWEVSITLEKIFEDKELPGKELPRVLEGDGYGIIEDCGGPGGLNKLAKAFEKKSGKQYREYCNWLGFEELDLTSFDVDDMNFRLKKVPRIYADAYEFGLEPTKQSLNLLMRKYKR